MRHVLPLLVAVTLLLCACGGSQTSQSSQTKTKPSATTETASTSPSPASRTPPKATNTSSPLPLMASQTAAPIAVLTPVSWQSTKPLSSAGSSAIHANLQGRGSDTLTVTQTASLEGTLAVIDSSGASILTMPHVGRASVLVFGAAHLPVLVLQDSVNHCGSGGCAYQALTWDASAGKFLEVPAPGISAFRYVPKTKQFEDAAASEPGGLFGFVSVGSHGISLDVRLYDDWQHHMLLAYAYAKDGTAAGKWVSTGKPQYTPQTTPPMSASTPASVLDALLQARALDIYGQGKMLLDAKSASTLWQDLAPLSTFGAMLFTEPSAAPAAKPGNPVTVSTSISGLDGQGLDAEMKAYRVDAKEQPVGGTYRVTSVKLTAIPLKVSSQKDVLRMLRASSGDRKHMTAAGADATIIVTAVGEKWQVNVQSGGHTQPWLDINAQTGAVTAAK